MSDRERTAPPRRLTTEERKLLEFLLSKQFPGNRQLQEQLPTAVVSSEESAGGPIIELAVDRASVAPAAVVRAIPIEAQAADSDGVTIHVLLHVRSGYLSELEVFREDSRPIQRLPDPGQLELIDWDDYPS